VGLVQIDTAVTNPPRATDTFSLAANLDANSLVGDTFTSPVQIYDSLGGTHTLIITYTKTAAGAWNYRVDTDDPTVSVPPAPVAIAAGALTFNAAGQLTAPAVNPTIPVVTWGNGGTSPVTTWEIIDASGNSTFSQYASPSSTSNTVQNGYGAGTIRSLSVDQDGIIIGNFSNGQTVQLSQVAISLFNNIQGLAKVGQNYWTETLASGSASIGLANQGGRGGTLGANLELSNVDVAEEFTKLIISQRGYQANSRIVTTTDQLLEETLNLKR
jgi:flagellar hook protein FlgE